LIVQRSPWPQRHRERQHMCTIYTSTRHTASSTVSSVNLGSRFAVRSSRLADAPPLAFHLKVEATSASVEATGTFILLWLLPSGGRSCRIPDTLGTPFTMTTGVPSTRAPGITKFDALIADVVVETPDTITAFLDLGQPVKYRAGQYVSIDPHQFRSLGSMTRYLEHLKGRHEPPRAYSMSSAPHEPYVAITIKEEVYDGVMP